MKYIKIFEDFSKSLDDFSKAGAETKWELEDGTIVKLSDIVKYLDSIKSPVIEINTDDVRDILIDTNRDTNRVDAADINFPIIVSKYKGKYYSILDGQHRLVKCIKNGIDKVKSRILELDNCPEKFKSIFVRNEEMSEHLQYHIDNEISVTESVFRYGSESYFKLLKESRNLYNSGSIELSGHDKELFESSDIGIFDNYNGEVVPLDLPMEVIEEINEMEYKGKEVKLNYPMRGGTKKYQVYVKNPKTGNVKKISFGDVHGGLTAKVSNPKARKAFAARHQCDTKNDKTTAGYWSCRINRYANIFGKSYPGFW